MNCNNIETKKLKNQIDKMLHIHGLGIETKIMNHSLKNNLKKISTFEMVGGSRYRRRSTQKNRLHVITFMIKILEYFGDLMAKEDLNLNRI